MLSDIQDDFLILYICRCTVRSWRGLLKNLLTGVYLVTATYKSDIQERNSRSPTFVQVGENIYVGGGLPVNYTDIVARQWGFSEAADYDYESNSCQPERMCGHYT